MRRKVIYLTFGFLLLGGLLNFVFAQNKAQTYNGKFRIKVSENIAGTIETNLVSNRIDGSVITGNATLDALNVQHKVSKIERVFPNAGKFEKRHHEFGLDRWYEFTYESGEEAEIVAASYKLRGTIENAEPVYKKVLYNNKPKSVAVKNMNTPVNDPLFKNQWHFYNSITNNGNKLGSDIWLQNAWLEETGSNEVIVAIIDGGIDVKHIDLNGNIWVNTGEIEGNGIDDDQNGKIDDVNGFNFVQDNGKIISNDHGTHVAGVVAAVNNNGAGIAGIAGGSGKNDGVRLMSCQIFGDDSESNHFGDAFIYAADNGAVIAQNSWGYAAAGVYEQVVLDAIDYFIANAGFDANHQPTGPVQGGLVIFSAGNDGVMGDWYPACYDKVIAVASINSFDQKSYFSNYGLWVDISAPGENIYSTISGNKYDIMSGTSMACPHVSGVVALIISQYKYELTPAQVKSKLFDNVDPIDDLNKGFTGKLGAGRLNAYKALINKQDDGLTPNFISDIAEVSHGTISAEVTFIAPGRGDENKGTTVKYDIRLDTLEITDENFYQTASIDFHHPQPAGFVENLSLNGLIPGTRYYCAIKSIDYFGNVSSISNVATFTTENAPFVLYNPVKLDTVNRWGSDLIGSIKLKNIGQEKLNYDASVIFDLGSAANWVTLSNAKDSVEMGKTGTIGLNYKVNALKDGFYTTTVKIVTNDPFHQSFKIELTILVYGNSATAMLSSSEIDFGKVYIGATQIKQLYLTSSVNSVGYLQVSSTLIENNELQLVNKVPLFIAPGDSIAIQVAYTPKAETTINQQLVLCTNNSIAEKLNIKLSGQGIQPPTCSIDLAKIDTTVNVNEPMEQQLKISNTGSDTLNVSFLVENLSRAVLNNNVPMQLGNILFEDFETPGLPQGWQISSSAQGWDFGSNLSSEGFKIPDHSNYAAVNDDAAGKLNNGQADYLIIPELSLNNCDSAVLTFNSYFTGDLGMKAYVEISFDKGITWIKLREINSVNHWVEVNIDLTQFANRNVMLAFHSDDQGLYSSGWAIDNVAVKSNLTWFTIDQNSGNETMLPGDTNSYTIKINANSLKHGVYAANLVILSNDPYHSKNEIPLALSVFDNSNVLLSGLFLDGVSLNGFCPDQYLYEVGKNDEFVPEISATAQNSTAKVWIEQAKSVVGPISDRLATITVTSNNAQFSKQYQVLFSKITDVKDEILRFKVFPNPVENVLTIESENNENIIRLNITDLTGKISFIQDFDNEKVIQLDVQGIESGIYIVTMLTKQGVYTSVLMTKK